MSQGTAGESYGLWSTADAAKRQKPAATERRGNKFSKDLKYSIARAVPFLDVRSLQVLSLLTYT